MTDYAKLSDAELMAMYKKAKEPAASVKTTTPGEFAKTYGPAAERAGKALGVDPQMLLGQWGLETGWGKSIIPGTNNLGNIKDFAGGGVAATDNMTGSKDKYRSYESPEAFADDFASLIQRKYPKAVGAKDPLAFATALKDGGYAEDPRYVDKVVQASRMAKPMNPVMTAGKAITDAVIPSANASEMPQESPYSKMSDEELLAAYQKLKPPAPAEQPSVVDQARGALNAAREVTSDFGKGALRGSASIGDTITNAASKSVVPNDPKVNWLINPDTQQPAVQARNTERQAGLAAYDAEAPDGLAYGAGKLTAEIAGTAGVGGALAAPLRAVAPALPAVGGAVGKLANAIGSGGMTVGGAPAATVAQGAGNLALRAGGGAVTGAASAGLVNPEDAKMGAMIGGAAPIVTKAAGLTGKVAGKVAGKALSGGGMSDEVRTLAARAKDLGIDIPADRLVDSKALNAAASSLNYVPFSGRAGTERKMQDQMNRALSRTFGQDSDNVTMALRKAQGDLGAKFEKTLQNTTVKVDQTFLDDLVNVEALINKELPPDGARVIANQINDVIDMAAKNGGAVDGQAAYNIKKSLDRIGKRNSNEAYYAIDMKQKLMDALNRSLGPQEAKAFADVRKQYGNMLSLEKLAQNGIEGDISIARLANMKNIGNKDLQELADISAQFLKPREGQHGSMQRIGMGLGGAVASGFGAAPAVLAGVGAGRLTNSALNSSVARNALMGTPQTNSLIRFAGEPDLAQMFYRAAPVAGTQP